ncbi:hypothetical protein QN277_002890 [Acacia crassicarpa]|uniref:Transcription repressor n=1 Tax=Acacia crassicarpa TaxID=499986 RepID=A0AAE1NAB1_9FABA|nr:hypothetical protein QN277_002890 [Acacia crassicarpa]
MPRNKRKALRSILRAKGGCGSCGTPKASDVYHPTPIPKISSHPTNPNPTLPHHHERNSVSGGDQHYVSSITSTGKLSGSIAVEMKSENPYNDFKQSILQMIIDRDIYSTTDLRELLQCFLQLNLPCHHQLILKAFNQICRADSPPSSLHANVSVL